MDDRVNIRAHDQAEMFSCGIIRRWSCV